MGEVKISDLRIGDDPALSPGEYLRYLREARRGPRMDGWTAAKGRATAEDNAIAEAFTQAVLAADPVRTQALELIESLALMVEGWHGTTSGFWNQYVIPREAKLIAEARELVRKAREGKA